MYCLCASYPKALKVLSGFNNRDGGVNGKLDTHPFGQFFEFKHIQDHAVLPIQNPTTPTALSSAKVNGLLQSREKLCRLIRYISNTNYLNLEVYLIYTFLFEQHMSSFLNFSCMRG